MGEKREPLLTARSPRKLPLVAELVMMSPPGSLGSEPNQTAKCAIWGSPVRGSRAGADASVALFGPCASGRRKGGGEGEREAGGVYSWVFRRGDRAT